MFARAQEGEEGEGEEHRRGVLGSALAELDGAAAALAGLFTQRRRAAAAAQQQQPGAAHMSEEQEREGSRQGSGGGGGAAGEQWRRTLVRLGRPSPPPPPPHARARAEVGEAGRAGGVAEAQLVGLAAAAGPGDPAALWPAGSAACVRVAARGPDGGARARCAAEGATAPASLPCSPAPGSQLMSPSAAGLWQRASRRGTPRDREREDGGGGGGGAQGGRASPGEERGALGGGFAARLRTLLRGNVVAPQPCAQGEATTPARESAPRAAAGDAGGGSGSPCTPPRARVPAMSGPVTEALAASPTRGAAAARRGARSPRAIAWGADASPDGARARDQGPPPPHAHAPPLGQSPHLARLLTRSLAAPSMEAAGLAGARWARLSPSYPALHATPFSTRSWQPAPASACVSGQASHERALRLAFSHAYACMQAAASTTPSATA
jgi:hypothetical protein